MRYQEKKKKQPNVLKTSETPKKKKKKSVNAQVDKEYFYNLPEIMMFSQMLVQHNILPNIYKRHHALPSS